MIGRRLKLARTAAGLSLGGLEDAIESLVTAQAIGKYERDESMPGSGVLIALAGALGVSIDYLVGDEKMVLEAIDFRKKASASTRDEAQVEAHVLRMLEGYLQINELLGLPSVELDKPRDAPDPVVNGLGEADRGARVLRDPPYEKPLAIREGEKPRRFKRLCLRALAEGAISEPKAAELLGISVRELDRRMNEPPESETA